MGSNQCREDSECHGARTCSQFGWCQGENHCDKTQVNEWQYDCREEQTPTPEKFEEWAAISNDPMWEDEDLWDKYGDYFMLWEERTQDDDDEDHHDEDHCEDKYLTMYSEDLPKLDQAIIWEMDIVYNWCTREPIIYC